MSTSYHVIPILYCGRWAVRRYGALRASKRFVTKAAAIRWAKRVALRRALVVYVHRRDGTVEYVLNQ